MAGSKRREKLEKEKRRRKKLEARRAAQPAHRSIAEQASRLIEDGEWGEAREILEAYDRAHAPRSDVLKLLLDVCHEQEDMGGICSAAGRLLKIEPDNPPLHLMFASACMCEARPASALLGFRRYVERWPDDPLAAGVRDSIAELEPLVEELLREAPFPAKQRLELAALHEETLAALGSGNYERCIEAGERLLARCPAFINVRNNLSQAYFLLGRTEQALAASRAVLRQQPNNPHALANLARHLLLLGQNEEAQAACQRLREVETDNPDIWSKKAETFAFFGDDEAVLETFAAAEQAGHLREKSPDVALLYHLAAVALARQGNHRQARKHWQSALQLAPGFELAEENLADSRKPVG
ncbi:MAG TPA: tetratricopeptide repeat protein, partial [Pirellulaceae bacterium]|nr:tetratricopeptide repeat protein [Pirellulaceae bacterium]